MALNNRVFLGMSGGVDSSVAAILLKNSGFDVVGYTFRVYDSVDEDCIKRQKGCCTVESIFGAKEIADKLGIEHHIIDLRKEFAETVIKDFTQTYLSGRTPNPCVECNKFIKWGLIRDIADSYNCRYLATGHYARIKSKDGRSFLSVAKDSEKDQTYFLWQIPVTLLSNTIFPLGELDKNKVREIARENGFVKVSVKADSQEICFIPDDDYRNFLTENVKDLPGPGNFIDNTGKIIGRHNGFPFYTIGQRKGLGIAMGERVYVSEIRPETNEVVLVSPDELFSSGMYADSINPGKCAILKAGMRLKVKTRYRSEHIWSELVNVHDDRIFVKFDKPVSAVTPGQSAVFYDDENDVVFGSKIIEAVK